MRASLTEDGFTVAARRRPILGLVAVLLVITAAMMVVFISTAVGT